MPPTDRDARAHWNERYRSRGPALLTPSPFLLAQKERLPPSGRALDVGGGSGRNAIWLAQHGLDVTLVDIAEEGLALARAAAEAADVPLQTLQRDVETDGLPAGSFDLITSFHFLHRPLFAQWTEALSPGGLLVFEQPTLSNLERHPKPSARFLLRDGELESLVQGLDILSLHEGWNETGRHEARLIARAPKDS